MKQIRLDNPREVTITDEAYANVLAAIATEQICRQCRQRYLKDTPQVAQNLCLECFQKQYAQKKLIYIGEYSHSAEGDVTHMFMDAKGYVYLTSTSSDTEPYRSTFETLMYHGFPVPKCVERDGQQVELSTWEWYIYGDVKKNAVLYLHHRPRTSLGVDVAYVTTKYGDTEEVNRGKGTFQKLFKQTREQAEASKDAQGYHLQDGRTTYQLSDSHLYTIISDLLSAEYDHQRKEHQ